ncbi:MAG TPA: HIT family protein [Candidatus Saccharimonadales bacterium]|nr:HIT family protein [Candidatus Saccharimonadales bacterium]
MSEPTVYDKIIDGSIPSYPIWEDEHYLAFLTPFGNTPGFSVVIPKINPGDNYLDVDEDVYVGLLKASRKVADVLRKAFDVYRVGLVIEGEGVPHLHVKLIPMHGLGKGSRSPRHEPVFNATYQGYLTTVEGPEMNDEQLRAIQSKIKAAA